MTAISTAMEWLIIYLMSLQLAINHNFSQQVEIKHSVISLNDSIFKDLQEPGIAIYCLEKSNNDTIVTWYLLPYQSFTIEQKNLSDVKFLTVTEHAIIYEKQGKNAPLNTVSIKEKFYEIIALQQYEEIIEVIEIIFSVDDSCIVKNKKQYQQINLYIKNITYNDKEMDLSENDAPIEDNMFIDTSMTNNIINDAPTEENIINDTPTEENIINDTSTEENIFNDKPMECTIYYDTLNNPTVHQWIKNLNNNRTQDKCWETQENEYTQTIKNHLAIWLQQKAFDNQKAFDSLMQELRKILNQCAHDMSQHENYLEFFVSKILQTNKNEPMMYEMFPDYTPKTTPDDVLDYRPSLSEKLAQLPEPSLQNLKEVIRIFKVLQKQAKQNPGKWINGNIVLGANTKEYVPSDEELLLSEFGNKIETFIQQANPNAIKEIVTKNKIKTNPLKYKYYTFMHVDAMGSGRFFYIDKTKNRQIIFPKTK